MLAGDHEIEFEIVVVEGDNLLVWKDKNGLWYLEGDKDEEALGFWSMNQLWEKLENTI